MTQFSVTVTLLQALPNNSAQQLQHGYPVKYWNILGSSPLPIGISVAPVLIFFPTSLLKMALTLIKELLQQRLSLLGLHREGIPKQQAMYRQISIFSITKMKLVIPEDGHPLICVPNFSHPLDFEWALQSSSCYVHDLRFLFLGECPSKWQKNSGTDRLGCP